MDWIKFVSTIIDSFLKLSSSDFIRSNTLPIRAWFSVKAEICWSVPAVIFERTHRADIFIWVSLSNTFSRQFRIPYFMKMSIIEESLLENRLPRIRRQTFCSALMGDFTYLNTTSTISLSSATTLIKSSSPTSAIYEIEDPISYWF